MTMFFEAENGAKLAVGVRWRPIMGDRKFSKEVAEKAKSLESRRYFHSKGRNLVGFVPDYDDIPKWGGKAIPFAFAFAQTPGLADNAIFLGKLPGGIWALVILRDGEPVFGDFEAVGEYAALNDRLREYLATESDVNFVFYGEPLDGHESVFDLQPLTVNEIASLPPPAGWKLASAGLPAAVVVLAVILVLGVAVAGGGYYFHLQEQKRKAALAAAQQQQQIDPVQLYKERLPALLASVQTGYAAEEMARTAYAALGKKQADVGGWNLAELGCEAAACTLNFVSTGPKSTFATFASAKEEGVSVLKYYLNPFGQNIQAGTTLPLPAVPGVAESDITSLNDFLLSTGSRLQGLTEGFSITFTEPVPYGVPAEIAGRDAEIGEILIKSGTWTVAGQWARLNELVGVLPRNMVADRIKVALGENDISFTIEGRYYVR